MCILEREMVAVECDMLVPVEQMHPSFEDWPVVYTIDNQRDVYVGESQHVAKRMRQHRANPAKQSLRRVRVIIDERFNKSVCLDLRSEEHTSELQSRGHLVCRLLLEKKKENRR